MRKAGASRDRPRHTGADREVQSQAGTCGAANTYGDWARYTEAYRDTQRQTEADSGRTGTCIDTRRQKGAHRDD